jgi:hypothetical protein
VLALDPSTRQCSWRSLVYRSRCVAAVEFAPSLATCDNMLDPSIFRWMSLQHAVKLSLGGEAEACLLRANPLQVQQALHKRTARLKKAGHRVARKQQELMHVVHVSTDLRKASAFSCTVLHAPCYGCVCLRRQVCQHAVGVYRITCCVVVEFGRCTLVTSMT